MNIHAAEQKAVSSKDSTFKICDGKEAAPYRDTMIALMTSEYKNFPYLYEDTKEKK